MEHVPPVPRPLKACLRALLGSCLDEAQLPAVFNAITILSLSVKDENEWMQVNVINESWRVAMDQMWTVHRPGKHGHDRNCLAYIQVPCALAEIVLSIVQL